MPIAGVLGIIGRASAVGMLDASIVIGGTLGAPAADAKIGIHDLVGQDAIGGQAPIMHELAVAASWKAGGVLRHRDRRRAPMATRCTRPRAADVHQLDQIAFALDATLFDLAPLAVFAPGPAGGAAGILDGKLEQTGLDPTLGSLHGHLHIASVRFPVAATIGTLRKAEVDLYVGGGAVKLSANGRLGAGIANITGTACLATGDATTASATIKSAQGVTARHRAAG